MKELNFLIQAFGFSDVGEFYRSTFGVASSRQTITYSGLAAFVALLANAVQHLFGMELFFFLAFVGLIMLEWGSGVAASFKRGEKHESRKMGRMLLKVLIYCLIIALLHLMTNIRFPEGLNFLASLSPFLWLYWTMLSIIIWQLWVSVLENLDCLGFRFARYALSIINKKFERKLNE